MTPEVMRATRRAYGFTVLACVVNLVCGAGIARNPYCLIGALAFALTAAVIRKGMRLAEAHRSRELPAADVRKR